MCSHAARSGVSWMRITPWNGRSISRIRNSAEDTESAQMKSVTTVVALRVAQKPNPTKTTVSHYTTITSNGIEIDVVLCSNRCQRIFPISVAAAIAWSFTAFCASLLGVSACSAL